MANGWERTLVPLTLAQIALGARVLRRMLHGAMRGRSIIRPAASPPGDERVSVVVPVLDERDRLAPCLDGLLAQGAEVSEIVIVDGGSRDGTPEIVRAYAERDTRVRLIDASPVPNGWNGKAWGLQAGLQHGDPATCWVLTVDADVRPAPDLVSSLLAHARDTALPVLSMATRQEVCSTGEALLHPSLLTTLVYRFGPPGRVVRRVDDVQANGQCFLARRDVLARCNPFFVARASRCEDITVARCLVAAGYPAGFYEGGELASVRMYAGWRETWRNWPRSLPLRDHYSGPDSLVRLGEVALVQALPLPLLAVLLTIGARRGIAVSGAMERRSPARTSSGILAVAVGVNGLLAAVRLGVLVGTARAYRRLPPAYWLSPLCDMPVAVRLWVSLLRRRHTWRGRVLV